MLYNKVKSNEYSVELTSRDQYQQLYANTNIDKNFIYHLTQSPFYYPLSNNVIHLAIYKNTKPVALTSVYLRPSFLNLFNLVRINRGPHPLVVLSRSEYLDILNSILYFLRVNRLYIISLSPEVNISRTDFTNAFICLKTPFKPWSSSLITLSDSEELEISKFKSKWRNTLKKGLKSVKIETVIENESYQEIIDNYIQFAKSNKFKSINIQSLNNWWQHSSNKLNIKTPNINIYRAYLPENPHKTLGAIGIVSYLETSLYLFGYSTGFGRIYHVNSVLLWFSIKEAIRKSHSSFDLGGLGVDTPSGIRKFKQGLNGNPYSLSGEYLCILNFVDSVS